MRGNRRFEVQFQCLPQIFETLFFSSAMAGNIDVRASGNEALSLVYYFSSPAVSVQ